MKEIDGWAGMVERLKKSVVESGMGMGGEVSSEICDSGPGERLISLVILRKRGGGGGSRVELVGRGHRH